MLSRIAGDLFWIGRYIERAEHLSRYMNVNYFNSLDAPHELSRSRPFVMNSMLYMAGLPSEKEPNQEDVLYKLTLDTKNPNSVLNYVTGARENAKGVRHLISSRLWESVNKYYHFVNDYPTDKLKKTGLSEFTLSSVDFCAIVKGKAQNTLLKDEVSALIMLGFYLERAIQVCRIMLAKLRDVELVQASATEELNLSHEWMTLLRCAESFDMCRRFNQEIPGKKEALTFLTITKECPISVLYCLKRFDHYVDFINQKGGLQKNDVVFSVGKISATYAYTREEEVMLAPKDFVQKTLNNLYDLGNLLEKEYFTY